MHGISMYSLGQPLHDPCKVLLCITRGEKPELTAHLFALALSIILTYLSPIYHTYLSSY